MLLVLESVLRFWTIRCFCFGEKVSLFFSLHVILVFPIFLSFSHTVIPLLNTSRSIQLTLFSLLLCFLDLQWGLTLISLLPHSIFLNFSPTTLFRWVKETLHYKRVICQVTWYTNFHIEKISGHEQTESCYCLYVKIYLVYSLKINKPKSRQEFGTIFQSQRP